MPITYKTLIDYDYYEDDTYLEIILHYLFFCNCVRR